MNEKIWITWEDHRRSRELSQAFGALYIALRCNRKRLIRYGILSIRTIKILLQKKPKQVFCQNPSIVLTALLCFLKPIFNYKLIVDRHSNFKFHTSKSIHPKWILFHWLSHSTLRKADLTIVTNQFLKSYIELQGGTASILPDKLPLLNNDKTTPLTGIINYVFISTFSEDEPINEVLAAAKKIDGSKHIYITGNYKNYKNIDLIIKNKPKNITLTGFISEDEYQSLLSSADAIIVITTQEHTLTCGAYEAVALEKPMILGNTETIKSYFNQGAFYTDTTPDDLAEKIKAVEFNFLQLKSDIKLLKLTLTKQWEIQFCETKQKIS